MATIPAQQVTELVHRLQTTQKVYETMNTPTVYVKTDGNITHQIKIGYNCRLITSEGDRKIEDKFISPAEVVVKVLKEGFVLE